MDEAVVRLLISKGAAVSATDKEGSTPLHVAAKRGDEAVARLLRDLGATDTLLSATRPPTSFL